MRALAFAQIRQPQTRLQHQWAPSLVLESDQQRVMLLLGRGVHRPEDIATSMGWDMNRCLSCLSGLEVLGSVVRMPEGYSAAH